MGRRGTGFNVAAGALVLVLGACESDTSPAVAEGPSYTEADRREWVDEHSFEFSDILGGEFAAAVIWADGTEPWINGSPSGSRSWDGISRACTGLAAESELLKGSFPVPHAETEELLSGLLDEIDGAVANCRRAVNKLDYDAASAAGTSAYDAWQKINLWLIGFRTWWEDPGRAADRLR